MVDIDRLDCIFMLSEWLLFNSKWEISKPYNDKNKYIPWDDNDLFVLDQHIKLDFIVLAHWSNNPQINMSPHLDTLSWFRANQSLLFLLNAVCLAEKQQIPIS